MLVFPISLGSSPGDLAEPGTEVRPENNNKPGTSELHSKRHHKLIIKVEFLNKFGLKHTSGKLNA